MMKITSERELQEFIDRLLDHGAIEVRVEYGAKGARLAWTFTDGSEDSLVLELEEVVCRSFDLCC